MNNKLYDVVLERCPQQGAERSALIERLAQVFGVPRELIATLVETAPRAVKSGVDAPTAETFARALYGAGAPCRIAPQKSAPPQGDDAPVFAGARSDDVAAPIAASGAGWLYFRPFDTLQWPARCLGCEAAGATERLRLSVYQATEAWQTAQQGMATGRAVGKLAAAVSDESHTKAVATGVGLLTGSVVGGLKAAARGECFDYRLPICSDCLTRLSQQQRKQLADDGLRDRLVTPLLERAFEPPVVQLRFARASYARAVLAQNPQQVFESIDLARQAKAVTRSGGDRDDYQPKAPMGQPELPLGERIVEHLRSFLPARGLFIAPTIPADALVTARRRCGVASAVEVYALLDCTHDLSASAAVLFGGQGIAYRNGRLMSPTERGQLGYEELARVAVRRGDGRSVELGPHIVDLTHCGMAVNEVVDLFRSLRAGLPRAEAAPPSVALDRAALLAALRAVGANKGLSIEGDIPPDKLDKARQRCDVPADETIVGLLDCTVFGSAKKCLLIGLHGLYYANGAGVKPPAGALAYSEFTAIKVRKKSFSEIALAPGHVLEVSGAKLGLGATLALLESLQRIARAGR